jgi:hypothetical protein
MSVIGWFIGVVLMILSFILWLAGLMGREGVLRIGRQTVAERREESKAELRPVNASNVVLGIVGILVGLAVVLIFAI